MDIEAECSLMRGRKPPANLQEGLARESAVYIQGVLCHLHHSRHLSQRCSTNGWDGPWAFKANLKNESETMHVKVADSDASVTSILNNITVQLRG